MTVTVDAPTQEIPMQQRPQPKVVSYLTLVALPTAVSCARSLTYVTLQDWKLPHLIDAASKVMDELVTMAVETTGTPDAPALHTSTMLSYIQARLMLLDDGRLIVEVVDQGSERPPEGWQFYYLRGGGKAVWHDIQTTTVSGLPRRVPSQRPAQPTDEVIRDPEVLRLVREGLEKL